MRALLALTLLGASAATADDAVNDLPSLVAAIEALQGPIKDFRCEFEGRAVYQGKDDGAWALPRVVGPDGLLETFGGSFIWQRDGDRRCDLYEEQTLQNPTTRENITQVERTASIVHLRDQKLEYLQSPNIRGALEIPRSDPLVMERARSNSRVGELFRFDEIRELVGDDTRETTVTDDLVDGRPLKLLSVYLKFKDIPNRLMQRSWIDMARSGQVVRIDHFLRDSLAARWDFELKPFRVGEAEVWMPVAGEHKSYFGGQAEIAKAPRADRARVAIQAPFENEPTVLRFIRVVDGTMEINKKPGAATFTLKHKPPAPKSAEVRGLIQRFDQKITTSRPSKAKAEAALKDQIAEADQQGRELIADPHAGIDWWTWSVGGLGLVLASSLAVLWRQRRTR